ncbi:MAG: RAMP superfamily CRISPR-associated protein, partial [Nitrososphaera sp.]|nr:RAMP superfamily CRISPR-associated protein [Nitrososphaera sp.]
GVKISPKSRTAEENKLFNLQLWRVGTTFPLRFELLISERAYKKGYADKLKQVLAIVLTGFKDGSITLGARKRRGYGQIDVAEWRIKTYNMAKPEDLLDWIEHGDEPLKVMPEPDIQKALGVQIVIQDSRELFCIYATFSLDGSLLIHSGSGQDDQGPDTVHLHSARITRQQNTPGKLVSKPILSGTSLSGALRARALRIAKTIAPVDRQFIAEQIVEEMWGADMEKVKEQRKKGNMNAKPYASRVRVEETVIEPTTSLVQNRIRIDRFTGGAFGTALFSEQPIFDDGKQEAVRVSLALSNPKDYEIGLFLLVLKDLWTGDLPLGSGSSIGRGRLR